MPTPLEEMRIVARRLQPLNVPLVVDGCASIVEEIRNAEASVKLFVSRNFKEMLAHPDFRDSFLGHQPEKARIPIVVNRLQSIAALCQD